MLNGIVAFATDSKVHDTVLITMVISSLLAALRRVKDATRWWQVGWNFIYDWATGFWSMKTGQPVHPVTTTQQLETHTDGSLRDVKLTTSVADPTLPASPAQP